MALYKWDDSYAVGIPVIDEQHKRLFDMFDAVHTAFSQKREKEILTDILPELERYTYYHFATEERLMDEYRFPDSPGHKAEHARFVKEVSARIGDLRAGKSSLSIVLLSFLANWLVKHIGYTDRALAGFLKNTDPRRFAKPSMP